MNIFRSEEKFIWKEYGDIVDKYNKLNSSRKLRQIFFFAPLVLILVIPFEDYTKEMIGWLGYHIIVGGSIVAFSLSFREGHPFKECYEEERLRKRIIRLQKIRYKR